MKQINLYSSSEFKSMSAEQKKAAYAQWNELSVSECMNIIGSATRQLNFKFNSPFNLSRARRNSKFDQDLKPVLASIDTLQDAMDELRADVSNFYDGLKKANNNDSSERGRSLDEVSGVPQSDPQDHTPVDSAVTNLTNMVAHLMNKLEALEASKEENKEEQIQAIQHNLESAQLRVG